MTAGGGFVPPMIIFPRKNMKVELLNGAPLGTIAACHPSGWIQGYIFTNWLQHFITHVKPPKDDPVVLVLDGHYSHTRSADIINLVRHLQPLDLAFMGPLKTYYSQKIKNWLKHPNNYGRTVS
ncbi:hypothetical protein Zmor_010925 [Zophobas morio]|uniref:DDE-1 domain-containing protein n=1 Tax=Zophobas morio TaxID=2755281 RepID=A0AA38IQD3_9CUCU|nr:hypothetical protein Zmor_010925 [Zophobas morio]